MSKIYYFGSNRSIIVNKREYGYFITICDFDKVTITMPSKRWCGQIKMAGSGVDSSLVENSTLKWSIGGAYYVCVRDRRVQIRRFFYHAELKEERPTKQGIVLTHREWERIKKIADTINADFADIAFEQPCYADSDHNRDSCFECNSFKLDM